MVNAEHKFNEGDLVQFRPQWFSAKQKAYDGKVENFHGNGIYVVSVGTTRFFAYEGELCAATPP